MFKKINFIYHIKFFIIICLCLLSSVLFSQTDYTIPPSIPPNSKFIHKTYEVPISNNIDDTKIIQSYLDYASVTKGRVLLKPNQTYVLSRQGIIGVLGIKNRDAYGYCLKIPSNVTLDLNGSTLKLSDNQDSCMIINNNPDSDLSGNEGIKIINGILDQNNQHQSNKYFQCGMYLGKVRNSSIENITVKNSRMCGFRIMGCENTYFNNLKATNIQGHGFYIGQPKQLPDCPNDLTVRNCNFGTIEAENCVSGYFYPKSAITTETVGNSYHITAENCDFRTIVDKQTVGGKIAGPSKNLTIDKIISDGSIIKLQHNPSFIKINSISAINTLQEALKLIECHDVQIGKVTAYNCGLNYLNGQIIWLNGTNISIDSIDVTDGHSKDTAIVREKSKNLSINNFKSTNCIGEVDIRGNVNINTLIINKDSKLNNNYKGIGIYNESSICNIENLNVSGNFKYNDFIVSSSKFLNIKRINLDGVDENGRIITLKPGISTTIPNTKLLSKTYTKTIVPVIRFIPLNSSSKNINVIEYSILNSNLTIKHSNAIGTEQFKLIIDEYIAK